MSNIKLIRNQVLDHTMIPNVFIDQYMPSANGSYVKVYLYLLRCISNTTDTEISISAIADHLEDTEKDIIRALTYWEKVDLILLDWDSQKNIQRIHMRDIYSLSMNSASSDPIPDEPTFQEELLIQTAPSISETEHMLKEVKDTFSLKPTYSEAQIKQLTDTDEIKWLLNILEIYLDRLIKPMDLQLVLYLYESLEFSAELIMYLYEYCVSKNKKNPSYIEAVALSWAEEGIDTVEKAEASTTQYNSNYNAVNKAFGLNRAPGQVEKQFIHKWLTVYGFTIDMVVEACNRTILSTQKPDFKYTDKILENWHKHGAKTKDQISKLDEEHTRINLAKVNQKAINQVKSTQANNRFNAFPQRNYTNEEYSSMEQRLLRKQ